jgi:tetratricopeptide (TPR) repeat protein
VKALSLDELTGSAAALADCEGVDRACELYATHFAEAVASRDVAMAIRFLHHEALLLSEHERYEEAEEIAQFSREMASACGLRRLAARETNLIGLIAYHQLDWSRAYQSYTEALELAQADHDDELIASVSVNLGAIDNVRGRFREARGHYLESIASAVRSGERACLVMAYNNLGMVCTDQEEWLEGLVYFDRGVEIANEFGDQRLIALLHVNRAEPLIELEEEESARRSLEVAEALGKAVGFDPVLADAERLRSRIARRAGDLIEALAHVEDALRIASQSGLHLHRAEALEERGRIRDSTHDFAAARADYESARSIYLSLAAEHDAKRIDLLLARVGRGGGAAA